MYVYIFIYMKDQKPIRTLSCPNNFHENIFQSDNIAKASDRIA